MTSEHDESSHGPERTTHHTAIASDQAAARSAHDESSWQESLVETTSSSRRRRPFSAASSSSSVSSSVASPLATDETNREQMIPVALDREHDMDDTGRERRMSAQSSTSSSESHESFHSIIMNEQASLLHSHTMEQAQLDEESSGKVYENNAAGTDRLSLSFLQERQSFEEECQSGGTLYVSGPKGAMMPSRNGYHRYNSYSSDTVSSTEDYKEGGSPHDHLNTRNQSNHAGNQTTDGNRIHASLIESGLRASSTMSNELRQRVGGNVGGVSSENRGRYSISNGRYPNRIRSFTSPDTRSQPPLYQSIYRLQSFHASPSNGALNSPPRSLLNSLDAGMSALRRWMMARSPSTGGSNPRTSRAAQVFQMEEENDEESLCAGSEFSFGGNHEHYAGSGSFDRQAVPSLSSLSYHGSIHSVGIEERFSSGGGMGICPPPSNHAGSVLYPHTIMEEEEHPSRQRANSEPERSRWASLVNRRRGAGGSERAQYPPLHGHRRRLLNDHPRDRLESDGNSLPSEMIFDMESSGERLNRVSFRIGSLASSMEDHPGTEVASQRSGNTAAVQGGVASVQIEESHDPLREARRNWIRINRAFQVVVTVVGLIFSFLLFSIMVTWVVLTSAYVVSIDEKCDVPLKSYFWLATIQLMLDVFRKEIMRFVFRFDPSRHREQIPTRVIFYNLAYLTYAMLVLRLGISSIFLSEGSQCPYTAKKLFNTTRIYVSITISAWLLVLFGYLIPFCIVAILLTRNGYSPAMEQQDQGASQNFGVFPLTHANSGAPPGCIERMKTLSVEDFRDDFPKECCICMSEFVSNEIIVSTECDHVFHKSCCQEWLRQARTCPVCRMDIPRSLGIVDDDSGNERDRNHSLTQSGILFSRGPFRSEEFHQDLANLVSLLRDTSVRR